MVSTQCSIQSPSESYLAFFLVPTDLLQSSKSFFGKANPRNPRGFGSKLWGNPRKLFDRIEGIQGKTNKLAISTSEMTAIDQNGLFLVVSPPLTAIKQQQKPQTTRCKPSKHPAAVAFLASGQPNTPGSVPVHKDSCSTPSWSPNGLACG